MSRSVIAASWCIILWALIQARELLLPFLLATLVTFMLLPMLRRLDRRRVPAWLGLTAVCLIFGLPFFAVGILAVHEIKIFLQHSAEWIARVQSWPGELAAQPWAQSIGLSDLLTGGDDSSEGISAKLSEYSGEGATLALHFLRHALAAGVQLAVTLLLAILMLASRKRLVRQLHCLVAFAAGAERGAETLEQVGQLIESYLATRFWIAAAIGVIDAVVLKGFGSHYSVLMGLVLGLSTLVPLVGFVLAIIPPIMVAFVMGHSVGLVAAMVGVLYGISFIESHFASPKLLGNSLNLNLLATIAAIFVGEMAWGVWGLVLAVPLLGVLRILLAASTRYRPWADLLAQESDEG